MRDDGHDVGHEGADEVGYRHEAEGGNHQVEHIGEIELKIERLNTGSTTLLILAKQDGTLRAKHQEIIITKIW